MLRRTSFLIGLQCAIKKPEKHKMLAFNRERHEAEMEAYFDPCSPRNLAKWREAPSFSRNEWGLFADQVRQEEQFWRNQENPVSYSKGYEERASRQK
ncbi:MAG: hypothetical protein Q8L78_02980 [Coxiellaceae bacterium]|nr:hypothetical protein [Coxiellaceae bacterium]